MPDTDAPAPPYGASVDGVRGLLPHRTLNPASKPSEGNAARWLVQQGARVRARIGVAYDALGVDERAGVDVLAAGVVELAVAAMVEDAAYPERAGVASTGYGEVLWARSREAWGDLLAALGVDEGEAGTGQAAGEPAFTFPEPLFRRDERW